ncbi:hypothetical protein BOTCAL_1863g00010 [Botryotinia calthae]|uniref:Uncharacterized protein n=1 Tax=Botryotinia calthae TaxID=38488 RepID=A0A4Y8CAT3_9HELO|nr:hypothetical protein BOTCAL_1863g00010 [Botryotinia calthae]
MLGRMAVNGWNALKDLMNELITVNNYGYKPLLGGELKDADSPKIPSREWIRKEFLDIANHDPALKESEQRWLWGGLELDGIEKAAQAIRQHND